MDAFLTLLGLGYPKPPYPPKSLGDTTDPTQDLYTRLHYHLWAQGGKGRMGQEKVERRKRRGKKGKGKRKESGYCLDSYGDSVR